MNFKFLLPALSAALICSCSSTYRNGQTPDDVYYSPGRTTGTDNKTEVKHETTRYEAGERDIRMATRDRRWRDFDDDYDCRYDPYHYGYNYGYYYNPYYYPSPVYISGAPFINPKNSTPRTTNLGSYNYSNMVVVNPKTGATTWVKSRMQYNNSNNSNYVRRIITPSTNSNTNSRSDNNTRTYTPSSSSGSRGSSSGTPVSRPGRGG